MGAWNLYINTLRFVSVIVGPLAHPLTFGDWIPRVVYRAPCPLRTEKINSLTGEPDMSLAHGHAVMTQLSRAWRHLFVEIEHG